MRLLLDTHVIVWAVSGRESLEPRIDALLADTAHELWMSPVSAWEIAMLAERGRLTLRPNPERWMAAAIAGLGLREAPLTSAIAFESRRLKLSTKDPADRFIAATASVLDCSLVTADAALRRVPGMRVIFCRSPKRRRTVAATRRG